MATVLPQTTPSLARRVLGVPEETFLFDVWHAPLVPAALAVTVGIVLDRYLQIPLGFSLVLALMGLAAWALQYTAKKGHLCLAYLAVSAASLGAAYHHVRRYVVSVDDIANLATQEPQPTRVRGMLVEEPIVSSQPKSDPLRSFPGPDATMAVLQVHSVQIGDDWRPVSGKAQLLISESWHKCKVKDEIEVIGRLSAPQPRVNPGEVDYASLLADQGIRAQISVHKSANAVQPLSEGWRWSLFGRVAVVRAWAQGVIQKNLPEKSGVAMALLLGEGSAMSREDWQKYIRTGVIHVLAVSGQHLVILGAFLWFILRPLTLRQRYTAWVVGAFLVSYCLLVGLRPSVVRATVMACSFFGALILRRPRAVANSFAFAWLVIIGLNPTSIFELGCELSFLPVAVLCWGTNRWFAERLDPLERLVEQTKPKWLRLLGRVWRWVWMSYVVSFAVWLVTAPLLASRYHLISPVAVLIGPPMVFLTAIALMSGFLLLASAACCSILAPLFAAPTRWSLNAADCLVDLADRLTLFRWYGWDFPEWWLWLFYLGLLTSLFVEPLAAKRRWLASAGLAWLCVGLAAGWSSSHPEELRCTFVAVGHGGCIVLEMPDGRTLLYDAGAIAGPEVTRRHIAPYLWHRGIRRIDDVFLSHADLDHFNGLPALIERFSVGQVTCTPTFSQKSIAAVRATLEALEKQAIPVRIVSTGDKFSTGTVEIEVLHPPPAGPEGNENSRSMVLAVTHAGHTILLTGDLDGAGREMVLKTPKRKIDVLMAPHHGSRAANDDALAAWARPKVAVSCQGPPRSPVRESNPYQNQGARVFATWPDGAVTVVSRPGELTVETFVTGQRFRVGAKNPF